MALSKEFLVEHWCCDRAYYEGGERVRSASDQHEPQPVQGGLVLLGNIRGDNSTMEAGPGLYVGQVTIE